MSGLLRASLGIAISLFSLLGMAALVSGCFRTESDAPHGTEVENEIGIGRLFLADGTPAAGATVRIYKVEEIPLPQGALKTTSGTAAVLVTMTGPDGRYRAYGLPAGQYNVLGSLDRAFSYSDSLTFSAELALPTDTLRAAATVRGFVGVQPHHDPRTVTVQLLGTHRFANVDSRGGFEFADLAGGAYSVRLTSTLSEYTPTITGFTAASGQALDLKDTLRLIYTGIPVVTGLKGSYDGIGGVVRLSWNASDYRDLDEYVVYRTVGVGVGSPAIPLARISDTVYLDTVFRESADTATSGFAETPPFSRKDPRNFALEYRVRIKSRTEAIGPSYGSFKITAASPTLVETHTSLFASGRPNRIITIGDAVTVVFNFYNPTRRFKTLRWLRAGTDTVLQSRSIPFKSGFDSFVFTAGMETGDTLFIAEVTDETGQKTRDSLRLQIVNDKPSVSVQVAQSVVRMGDTIRFQGKTFDQGAIVKWEWDIGNTGAFVNASGPDTSFPTPGRSYRDGDFFCALRVTDEDGNAIKEVFGLTISAWQSRRGLITQRRDFGAAVLNGRIYVAGGIHTFSGQQYALDLMEAYDPAADRWEKCKPMSLPRFGLELTALNGKLYAIGGGRLVLSGQAEWTTYSTVEEYDPAEDRWRMLPPLESAQYQSGGAAMGDRIYVLNLPRTVSPNHVLAYDPLNGISGHPFPIFQTLSAPGDYSRISAVAWNGRIHAFGSLEQGQTTPVVLDTLLKTMTQAQGPLYSGKSIAAAALGGKVVLTGFDAINTAPGKPGTKVVLYDMETGEVSPKSPLLLPRIGGRAVTLDGKIYSIGGYRSEPGGNVFSQDMEMLDLSLDP